MAVNLISVLVASVASFFIGFLWYGPLFGKEWRRLMKFSVKDMKKMKMTPRNAMVLGFTSTLVMVYVLALFIEVANPSTLLEGVMISFWIWLGFIATNTLGTVLWEDKPLSLYFLNNCYNLVNLLVAALILMLL